MHALSSPSIGALSPIPESLSSIESHHENPKSERGTVAKSEPLSPFMPWSAEERAPLPQVEAPSGERSLLADLLREPSAVTERLLEPSRLQGLVLGSVAIITLSTSFFAATASAARGKEAWWGAAVLTSLNVLMSLAASLGPIYATGILVAARVPLARLVAALLAATAAGSLLLAGMAPALYLVWRLDGEWSGPLMLVSAFLLSGAAAGARIHRLLSVMAETVTRSALGEAAKLSPEDAFRVGILARVSWMMLAFTLALGFWAFNALG
ncbi:hypothetical protein [Hyalangium rubrum]|uniref:Uncharacterized protein n=1 Tax=Hyalangium rubrum TaxID=3103134 RepID=A0ABU5HH63_9BACT|nr:hypothetical protein [Hyalangium sp. s54d21]MDY7231430.1 hypothetical protein [Hyalangium sp. s54d21]